MNQSYAQHERMSQTICYSKPPDTGVLWLDSLYLNLKNRQNQRKAGRNWNSGCMWVGSVAFTGKRGKEFPRLLEMFCTFISVPLWEYVDIKTH
jgi:hypothetical protein